MNRRDFLRLIGAGAAGCLLPLSLAHSREATVDGKLVYDPRFNSWRCSDNLALIMADLLSDGAIVSNLSTDKALGNHFWDKIGHLADWCERAASPSTPPQLPKSKAFGQ